MPRSANDEIFDVLRAQAKVYNKKQNQLAQQSQQAFKRGNKQYAKKLSKEGKQFKSLANKENQMAAEQIFAIHNQDRDDNEIDLHGLFVAEAIDILTKRIEIVKSSHQQKLVVIVGQGHHSQEGPKIKPAVIKFANKHNMDILENSPNAGCITFNFNYFGDRSKTRNTNRTRGDSQNILEVVHRPQHPYTQYSNDDQWHAQSRVPNYPARSHSIVSMPNNTEQRDEETNNERSSCQKISGTVVVLGILVLAGKLLGFY